MKLKENVSEHVNFLKSQTHKTGFRRWYASLLLFLHHSGCTGNDYSKVPVINTMEGGFTNDEFMVEK